MRTNQSWSMVLSVLLLALSASAQTDAGNGVARVSFISGEVTIERGDSGDLTEAAINAPLVTGDRILTGPGSRAEVQFDYGNFVRLAPNAEIRMQELRPERYLVAVADGTASFSRVDDYDSEVEINTPSISVRPARKGNYRVSVLPDGTTEVTVRDGMAEIYSPNGVERLGENRTMLVRGDRANPEFQFVAESRRDDFDEWNRDRDRMIRRTVSYQYVDRSVPGAYELDAYGSWVDVAPYGRVWRPRVTVGWAPYRSGRWAWVDYYGWNWVSYDPWGWAPYHYGRWFNNPGYGWCWWPGGRVRHHYAPAVVGFVGFNIGNVGIGIGFGNVGWVPLAPYETFHPWWGNGRNGWYRGGGRNNRTYVDNSVNIVNNVNITNVYRNARVNNGVTVVNGESFRRGASVNPVRVGADTLRSGNVVRGQLPVAPDRGSLQYTNRSVDRGRVASRLDRTADRKFYTRGTQSASRGERPNFETQRGAMEQVQRQAFGRGDSANGAVSRSGSSGRGSVANSGSPAGRGSGDVSGRGAGEPSASVGRGGTSTSPQRGASVAQSGTSQRGGWRRFGEPVNNENGRGAATGRGAVDSSQGNGNSSGRGNSADTGRGNSVDSGRGNSGATSRGGSTESSGWRRFGEPVGRGSASQGDTRGSGVSNRGAVSSSGRGSTDSGNRSGSQVDGAWSGSSRGGNSSTDSGASSRSNRRTAPTPSVDRGASSGRTSDAFSRGSSNATSSGRGGGNADSNTNRNSSSTSRGSSSRSSAPAASQERVRVNPSIVRERGSGGSGNSSGGGASRSVDRNSGSSRGGSSGRSASPSSRGGDNNRSSIDGSSWRRFEGGAASGIQAYGEAASRSTSRGATSRSSQDAFSRSSSARSSSPSSSSSRSGGYAGVGSSGSSRTYDAAGSSRSRSYEPSARSSSRSGSYSAPASSSVSRSRGSYSAPSRSVYSGASSSRQSSPSYRSAPSSRGSSGASISRGSYGGGGMRSSGGASRGASSRGGSSSSRGGGRRN